MPRRLLALAAVALAPLLTVAACGDEPNAPAALAEDAGLPEPDTTSAEAAAPELDVPPSLVETLSVKPYVEGSCTKTTYPGWPHEAQRCTYRNGLVVVVANPPPERVARWIVEASKLIPALDGLQKRDPSSWQKGLEIIALHTLGQSSRIFPLDGEIWENGEVYQFDRGVTSTCSTGCYCRVNSTSRPQWCKYAAEVLKSGDEATCLTKMGTKKLTTAWLSHCFDNHVAAWSTDANAHYRAMAWNANLTIAPKFPDPSKAASADVVAAVSAAYPR